MIDYNNNERQRRLLVTAAEAVAQYRRDGVRIWLKPSGNIGVTSPRPLLKMDEYFLVNNAHAIRLVLIAEQGAREALPIFFN